MEWLLLYLIYALGLSLALGRAGLGIREPQTVAAHEKKLHRLLIIGATGGTGRHLVEAALARGYSVTAMVRDPKKLGTRHPDLKLMRGDVLDPGSVDQAMAGQDAVLCALGHHRYFYPTRILSQGTANLVAAMKRHKVQRIVCETSLGIGGSAGRMGLQYTLFTIPVILPFYFWDKTRQEQLIAASEVEWIIVRPGVLRNRPARGEYRHGLRTGSFLWTVRISREDVASFMLDQVSGTTYIGTAAGVCW